MFRFVSVGFGGQIGGHCGRGFVGNLCWATLVITQYLWRGLGCRKQRNVGAYVRLQSS